MLVVWQARRAGRIVAGLALRRRSTRRWTRPTAVAPEAALEPRIAASPAGDATVVAAACLCTAATVAACGSGDAVRRA